jgi:hypothetical protein
MEGVLTCKPHPQINEKSRKKFGQTSRYDTDCVVSAASLQHLGRRGDYLGKEETSCLLYPGGHGEVDELRRPFGIVPGVFWPVSDKVNNNQ